MDRTRIARLCCLSWPRGLDGQSSPLLWRAPFRACGSESAADVVLGAAVAPWALLKGLLVMLPGCIFATVGSVLILPTSLGRGILNILAVILCSKTMSWQRRLLWALLWIPLFALWLPAAVLLMATAVLASLGTSFLIPFNATYIAAFYWPESDIDDPMEFQVPQQKLGRVLFGISEAFVYVVDTAEWYIELYLDYLEPLSLHYVDPAAHAKPPPRGTKRKPMRVATQQVEEGKGQRWIAERFQLDCEQVPGTTTNALFADHPHNAPDVCSASRELDSGRATALVDCYKGGTLGADLGHTFSNPLSVQSVRVTFDSDRNVDIICPAKHDAQPSDVPEASAELSNGGAHSPRTPTAPPAAVGGATSEWSLIRRETLRRSSNGADASPVGAPVEAPPRRAGQQRSAGEWGLERSRTYGPCDARPCGCTTELRPGALVVTVLFERAAGTKLWRFCPKPACYGSQPEEADLPGLPQAFPIDRLARVTVLEQLELDKLGVRYYCT